MPETTIRMLSVLALIPRNPRRISVTDVAAKLGERGLPISVRSVQRDLNALSRHFPLTSDGAKPAGWSWAKEAVGYDLPAMDPAAALAFRLAEDYLKALLPQGLASGLRPWFEQARRTLSAAGDGSLRRWSERIRAIPMAYQLLPPDVDPGVTETVQEALLKRRRVEFTYRPLAEEGVRPRRYEANPLGLVHREGVMYLVATLWAYEDIRQLALHRMSHAIVLDGESREPRGFSLSKYVDAQREFDFPLGKQIKLELSVAPWVAAHLRELRLSPDQVVDHGRTADARVRVRATVPDTEKLRWWLRHFGDAIVVLKPVALRREFARTASRVAASYRSRRR